MATEQDELKVRVSFQDDASHRLAYLRDSINQVTGGGSAAPGLHNVTGQVGELEKAIAKLAQEALGIGRQTQLMARAFGVAPVAMGLIGFEAGRLSQNLGKASLAMRDLANAARLSGSTIGQMQSVVEAFAQAGVPKADAVQAVQRFGQAVYQLGIPGSQTRQELINSAGKYRGEMIRLLDNIVAMKDPVDQLNAAIQASWAVHDWEIKLGHSEVVARQAMNRTLQRMNIDPATVVSRDLIEKMDDRRATRMKTIADHQTELGKQLAIKAATEERISTAISAANAVWETWAAKQVIFFEDHLLKDLQAMEDKGVMHGLFDHFLDTPHWLQWLPRMFTAPGWMVGDKPRPGIDDWKTMHPDFGGDTSKLPDKTKANTEQVQRLTDNVKNMINKGAWGAPPGTPARRMAKGGVVQGPTRTLVGEAGPEAIVTSGGASIVNKPTVTTLGADGPAAVIPLTRGDRNRNPGNIKMGPEARYFGATDTDEQGHAVFPSWEAGAAAQAALLRRQYQGKTIAQIGRDYAEDPRWGAGVMKIGGYGPNDIPDMNSPIGMARLLTAIRTQEGTHIPSDISAQSLYGVAMAEGGVVLGPTGAMGGSGLPSRASYPRSVFSVQQAQDYLNRTQLFSNPVSDIRNEMLSPGGGMKQAGVGMQVMGAASGLLHTTAGRAYAAVAGLAGMTRAQANASVDLAMAGSAGPPKSAGIFGSYRGVTELGSASKQILGGPAGATGTRTAMQDISELGEMARGAIDSAMRNEVNKVVADTSMEIHEENAPPGTSITHDGPLFKRVKRNRVNAPPTPFAQQYTQYPAAESDKPSAARQVFSPVAGAVNRLRGIPEPKEGTGVGGIRG